jgi:O-antigen/teichoic acid export membrane protein
VENLVNDSSAATSSSLFEPLKRLSSQSLIYGVGHVATRIISFLLLPFYTHLITPAEYGEVTLLFIFIAVCHVFYVYGFDISFLRYYVMEDNSTERRRIYGGTMASVTVTSLLFTAILILLSNPLVSVVFKEAGEVLMRARLIKLCGVILFLDTISVFPFLVLRGQQKPTMFTVLKLLNVLVTIGFNIWLVAVWKWGMEGIFWANVWASLITTVVVFAVTIRYLMPSFSWAMLKEFAIFGFPNIPSLFFVMVIELSDRKILEVMRGAEEVGLYSTGYKMGMFMAIVANAFRFAWQPFFLDHAKKPDAERTFARVLTYYIWVSVFLFLGLIFFIMPLIEVRLPILNSSIIDPRFWAGMGVFPIILVAHIMDGVYANLNVGIYIKKKTHFLPIITGIAALVNLVGNLLLIPSWGMFGAAWTTLWSYFLMAALLYWMIRRHYPIQYEWRRIGLIVAVSGALTGLFFLFPAMPLWTRAMLLLAFPVLLYVVGFYDGGEKRRLAQAWSSIIRRV